MHSSGPSRAQIEGVRVAEPLCGRTLGARFLEWAIEQARREACGLVQLTSDLGRYNAHRISERLGFECTVHGLKLALDRPRLVDELPLGVGRRSRSLDRSVWTGPPGWRGPVELELWRGPGPAPWPGVRALAARGVRA